MEINMMNLMTGRWWLQGSRPHILRSQKVMSLTQEDYDEPMREKTYKAKETSTHVCARKEDKPGRLEKDIKRRDLRSYLD